MRNGHTLLSHKSVYARLCDCAKLVLALKSLCVICFKFSVSVCVCLYLCSPQKQAWLINHAVFRLGLQKEKQVNARVTNAVERAGKISHYSFLLFSLIHTISGCSHFSIYICNPYFLPSHLFSNNK